MAGVNEGKNSEKNLTTLENPGTGLSITSHSCNYVTPTESSVDEGNYRHA